MSRDEGTVEVQCEIGPESAKAIRITVADDREVWVPFSVTHEIHKQEGRIVIDRWFANKEDLL